LDVAGTVQIAGGSLFLTNATHDAVLDVRSGSVIIDDGELVVDRLVMTNACGLFVRNGGSVTIQTRLLDPALDADGDGLPNYWEDQFGLDPLDARAASGADGDPDLDGVCNLAEFIAGNDPTNSTSRPLMPVRITTPTNGFVIAGRFIDVVGDVLSAPSVVVTNRRVGAFDAQFLDATNWSASNVRLKLGTNELQAIASCGTTYTPSEPVTVIRINTNYVDTTLRTGKAKLTLAAAPGGDAVTYAGVFNPTGITFNPATDPVRVMFGDFEAVVPADSVALDFAKRRLKFTASGFTLTNLDSFPVGVTLGDAELGPDEIAIAGTAVGAGKFSWIYGKPLPLVEQFFVDKVSVSTNSFTVKGTLNVLAKPSAIANLVCFGIGDYDETLAVDGWLKATGNLYTYKRPTNHPGAVLTMTLDFDRGRWTCRGRGSDLRFLATHPATDFRLEIADFAASYPVTLTIKGMRWSY
jgi:hypothetical protein